MYVWYATSKFFMVCASVLMTIVCCMSLTDYLTDLAIPARSHTFVEIDHKIISMVIFLPSAESFKKGCCQL